MIRRPPRSTLFPTRRSSDLGAVVLGPDALEAVRRDGVHVGQDLLALDRKSTRLNSSHLVISYAVFCLKKKTDQQFEGAREEPGHIAHALPLALQGQELRHCSAIFFAFPAVLSPAAC